MNNDIETKGKFGDAIKCAVLCGVGCTAACAVDAILPVGDLAGAAAVTAANASK